jgi:hypothetical protein
MASSYPDDAGTVAQPTQPEARPTHVHRADGSASLPSENRPAHNTFPFGNSQPTQLSGNDALGGADASSGAMPPSSAPGLNGLPPQPPFFNGQNNFPFGVSTSLPHFHPQSSFGASLGADATPGANGFATSSASFGAPQHQAQPPLFQWGHPPVPPAMPPGPPPAPQCTSPRNAAIMAAMQAFLSLWTDRPGAHIPTGAHLTFNLDGTVHFTAGTPATDERGPTTATAGAASPPSRPPPSSGASAWGQANSSGGVPASIAANRTAAPPAGAAPPSGAPTPRRRWSHHRRPLPRLPPRQTRLFPPLPSPLHRFWGDTVRHPWREDATRFVRAAPRRHGGGILPHRHGTLSNPHLEPRHHHRWTHPHV